MSGRAGAATSATSAINQCAICLCNIDPKPLTKEEGSRVLDCTHIFHNECVGSWLKKKHNCPLCRAPVEVSTPEATVPEMTLEEILSAVRDEVVEIRRVRWLDLNENTQVAQTARKVNAFAGSIFGW